MFLTPIKHELYLENNVLMCKYEQQENPQLTTEEHKVYEVIEPFDPESTTQWRHKYLAHLAYIYFYRDELLNMRIELKSGAEFKLTEIARTYLKLEDMLLTKANTSRIEYVFQKALQEIRNLNYGMSFLI